MVPSMSNANADGFGFNKGSGWLIVVGLRGARFQDVVAARNCSQTAAPLGQACTVTLRAFLQAASRQHGRVAIL